MNLIELSRYLQNEELAEAYLYDKGILKKFEQCPYCGCEKIGNIRRDRIRCYRCKKEWHKRKDSFLESRHISASKFIGFLKLYSEEVNLLVMSSELDIERKTTIDLHAKLREIIFISNSMQIPISNNIMVYVQDGKIKIAQLESDPNKYNTYALLDLKCYKEFGSIYSFLIKAKMKFGGHSPEKSLIKSFLSYTKMKSLSYFGVSEKYFLEYLSELVIKFNNSEIKYFDYLLKLLVAETTQAHKITK